MQRESIIENRSLIIGNSDGIGLAFTKKLLEKDWSVLGLSRSDLPVEHPEYTHSVIDVRESKYPGVLNAMVDRLSSLDLCVYCAGIGEELDISHMDDEACIIEVNLLGLVKTASVIIPAMISQGRGHFIGLSSVADEILSPVAPSYHASKAGFSNYLEGLALSAKPWGVNITNVRFGFVDTKMAKGDVKPFQMTVDRAVDHLLYCLKKKPMRYTAPRIVIPLVKFRGWMLRRRLR